MSAWRKGAAFHVRTEARAFCIWREGKAVNWDCTVLDLAEATKLPVHVVRYICAVRDWPVRAVERDHPAHQPLTSVFADNFPREMA